MDNRPFGSVKPYMFLRNKLKHTDSQSQRYTISCFLLIKPERRVIESSIYVISLMIITCNYRVVWMWWWPMFMVLSNFDQQNVQTWWLWMKNMAQPNFVLCRVHLTKSAQVFKKLNTDIPNIATKGTNELCTDGVVAVSKYFYNQFAMLTREVMRHKKLSSVWSSRFWRLEYQMRGVPHVHMKLWIKDGLVIDRDNKSMVQSMIACIPSNMESPILSDLMLHFQ